MPQTDFEVKNPETGLLIRGWKCDHPEPRMVLVCAHGFMMNRAELAPIASRMHPLGATLYFHDFRAHGSSQGKKSGFGYLETSDLVSVIELARRENPGVPILILGSSMGAACAAFTAASFPKLVDGLILDSCYDRLDDAVNGWWLFIAGRKAQALLRPAVYLGMPMAGISPKRVSVAEQLTKVECPTLVLHGDADTLATPKAAQTNFDALAGPKELVWFSRRNHSEARWEDPEKYYAALISFIEKHFIDPNPSK